VRHCAVWYLLCASVMRKSLYRVVCFRLFVWFEYLLLPKQKKLFQKSQIIELCVSLSNTESRTEHVSSVTTVSPLCPNPSVGLCSSSTSGFPFSTHSTCTVVHTYWWRTVKVLSLSVLLWQPNPTHTHNHASTMSCRKSTRVFYHFCTNTLTES